MVTVENRQLPNCCVLTVGGTFVDNRVRAASKVLVNAAEPSLVSRRSNQLAPESSAPASTGNGGNTARVACPRVRFRSSRKSSPVSRSITAPHF